MVQGAWYRTVLPRVWAAFLGHIDCGAACVSLIVFFTTSIYPFYVFDHINSRIIACKLIQLIAVYLGVRAFNNFRNRLDKAPELKFGLILFGIFFGIELLFLVLLYPGGWRWDDITLFLSVFPSGDWPTWQNYLSAVFYMTCYLTIPMPAFIVCVQVFVISAIMAFVAYRIWVTTSAGKLLVGVLGVLVSLLPPLLNMNLYPLRAALHSYLFLLVVFIMVDHFRNRISWTTPHIVFLAFVSAIVCVWRTECIFLVALLPIAFFVLSWNRGTRLKATAIFTFSLLGMVGIVGYYQFSHVSDDYVVTAYVSSLPEYAHRAKEEGNERLIEELGKAYDVDVLDRAYVDGVPGSTMFWMKDDEYPFMRQDPSITQDEYSKLCRDSFIAGTLAYPDLFLANRIGQAFDGPLESYSPGCTTNLYEDSRAVFDSFRSYLVVPYPFNLGVRATVASFIEAQGDKFEWVSIAYDLRWVTPVYIIAFLVLAFKRRKEAIAIPLFGLQALVTLLLAPKYYFMYYYAFYLGGVLLVALGVGTLVTWWKTRECITKKRTVHDGSRDSHGHGCANH